MPQLMPLMWFNSVFMVFVLFVMLVMMYYNSEEYVYCDVSWESKIMNYCFEW